MLAEGELTLSGVQLLARKLTPANHDVLRSEAAGRTKFQIQELLARRFPQADLPSTVRKLPTLPLPATPAASATGAPPARAGLGSEVFSSQRAVLTPLAPERYKVTFTADSETRELLEFAADMLSHTIPS